MLSERASRLFRFLSAREQLKQKTTVDVDAYARSGAVRWWKDLPDEYRTDAPDAEAVSAPEVAEDILSIPRPPHMPAAPRPEADVLTALEGPWDDPSSPPRIKGVGEDGTAEPGTAATAPEEEQPPAPIPSAEAVAAAEDWLSRWGVWAAEAQRVERLAKTYADFFELYDRSTQESDILELVLGVGLLSWQPSAGQGGPARVSDKIRRHLLTVPVQMAIDEETAALTLRLNPSAEGMTAETDMIPPRLIPDQTLVGDLQQAGAAMTGSPLDPSAVGDALRGFMHRLHSQGEWISSAAPATPGASPVAAWAPALILRERSRAGLVTALDGIADQIEAAEDVPRGLAPLLDPDLVPPVDPDPKPGAVLTLGDEVFSPLPLNDVQRRILQRVDSHAQTLVQGPPGTGKTHTAAALITHLLAQGKRVLITAETERALREVREKLPDQIRPLAVSVVGTNRDDMADLRVAVDTISEKSTTHDPADAARALRALEEDVDRLRARRGELFRLLRDTRQQDVAELHRAPYTGTLASIARQHANDAGRYGWIEEYVPSGVEMTSAPSSSEALALLASLRRRPEEDALRQRDGRRPPLDACPDPEAFAALLHAARGAGPDMAESPTPGVEERARRFHGVDADILHGLEEAALRVSDEILSVQAQRFPWVEAAAVDVLNGVDTEWSARRDAAASRVGLLQEAAPLIPPPGRIVVTGSLAQVGPMARRLLGELGADAVLKTRADGSVKIGLFAPGVVRESRELFEGVHLDGRQPSTGADFRAVVALHDAIHSLDALDRQWPGEPPTDPTLTVPARAAMHEARLQVLERILALGDAVRAADAAVREAGGAPVRWSSEEQRGEHVAAVRYAQQEEQRRTAVEPLEDLRARLDTYAQWAGIAPAVTDLASAVAQRDQNAYAEAHAELTALAAVKDSVAERARLRDALQRFSPALAEALVGDPADEVWDGRLADLDEAVRWRGVEEWIITRQSADVNQIQEEIAENDRQIRACAESIAATRAWSHALDPERLPPSRRADLRGYSQLVRRLGKGTGKHAEHQRAAIRQAMVKCRPAVPVWIMPLYRVTEQFEMIQDMFDVVVVDEASQAGAEAVFLQYLAPKIVVIGDDKQVTPSEVGIDQSSLQDLAQRYLSGEEYKPYWEDPQRSLFDEAAQRYGGQLTLTEHRRCVPEIIEFSNQIAYRPNNVELVPVRQFGADRLDPWVITQVEDGEELGSGSDRVNQQEARALVADVLECLDDPRYDGKTMAVISLGGPRQAKYIEGLLLQTVGGDVMERRGLRVGLPPAFQGAERDVVFLSLVTAKREDKRLAVLTMDRYVQRFNVAVSRAKDQVRLFHTVHLDQLTNKSDLRYKLLDYAYGVARRGRDFGQVTSALVSDVDRQPPFDSLFEQRVYNRIVRRGYSVTPQFQAMGYSIDLVVVGGAARLAVECDGDHWHGPEQYAADMARQRELERCGWEFFRVREAAFYMDPDAALEPLWEMLDALEIRPLGEEDEDGEERTETLRIVRGRDVQLTPRLESGSAGAGEEPPSSLPGPQADADEVTEAIADIAEGVPGRAGGPDLAEPIHAPAPLDAAAVPRAERAQDFTGVTVPVLEATPAQLRHGLLDILAAEGPALGGQIQRAYVHASGGRKVGRLMAQQLSRALTAMERDGLILSDDPLREGGVQGKTFRLPTQPLAVVRLDSHRSIREVPPREIAAQMDEVSRRRPDLPTEALLRATLESFGGKRMTAQIQAHLERVHVYWVAERERQLREE